MPNQLIGYTFADRTGVVEFLSGQLGAPVRINFDAE